MIKINILKWLYKHAPMNFYAKNGEETVIKSINNTFLGYKFNKNFTEEEITDIWGNIKKLKRFSTIIIFISFLLLLYKVIFPNYDFFINPNWYYTVIPTIIGMLIFYNGITFINTKFFEKRIKNKYGEYEKTIFIPNEDIDLKYYKLFKIELAKAFCLIALIVMCFSIGSPFKMTLNKIEQHKYNEAIRITTIGSKIFPVAPEWYSLRGFSRFQTKDYEGAIEDYDKAYRLGPDEYNVINFDNKIYIKYYLKKYKSALKDFDYEISHASDSYEKDSFLWDKAQFLYNIKKYQEALDIYNSLLVRSENDRIYLLPNRLYYERAQIYKALGKEKEAEQDTHMADDLSMEESFKNPIPQPSLLLDDMR